MGALRLCKRLDLSKICNKFQARNQRGDNRAIAPLKFLKSMYLLGTATSYIILLPPKISVGCGPAKFTTYNLQFANCDSHSGKINYKIIKYFPGNTHNWLSVCILQIKIFQRA